MSKIKDKINMSKRDALSDVQYMLRKWEFSNEVINKIEAILYDNSLELNPWLNIEEE